MGVVDYTLKDLVEDLNNRKIVQKRHFDYDEAFLSVIKQYKKGDHDTIQVIDRGIWVDTRRWYETSITVFNTKLGLLGVRHISNIFSESSEYEDMNFTYEFYEMEPVQVTTYIPKN